MMDAAADARSPRGWTTVVFAGLSAAIFVAVFVAILWLAPGSGPNRSPAGVEAAAGPAMPVPSTAEGEKPGGHPVTFERMAVMTDKLAARLKDNPADADGWAMLARTYAVTGRDADAVLAFEKAVALKRDDPMLLADYADALSMTRERKLDGEPAALIERSLNLDPENVKALSLAGSAAFERNDLAAAIGYWEKLLRVAPADSPFVERAREGIALTRAR